MQGLRIRVGGHLSHSVLWGACLLPHQTGEHPALMVTPLQVRLQAIGIDAGAAEGAGRSGWCLQDLNMRIFKSTDLGAEVMYTLWQFDVDAFLEQYDEASMCPHIFASLCGYPGKMGPHPGQRQGYLCAGPADAHGEDVW